MHLSKDRFLAAVQYPHRKVRLTYTVVSSFLVGTMGRTDWELGTLGLGTGGCDGTTGFSDDII